MEQAKLQNRIHSFLARKEQKFPELHSSVKELTRQLEVEDRAHDLIHYEEVDNLPQSRALRYA